MPSAHSIPGKFFLAIIAITAWFALGLQLYILIDHTPENGLTVVQAVGRFFHYFTILTNLLVAIASTSLLLFPQSKTGLYFSKPASSTALAVYILLVGLVYNILLRSLWDPIGLQKLVDELLHVAVPLLFVLYWGLFAPKHPLQWKHAIQWLLYPAVYLAYALLRGAAEGFYPYPFMDVNVLGYGLVFRNAAGMLVLFVITGLLFVFIANQLSKSNPTGH